MSLHVTPRGHSVAGFQLEMHNLDASRTGRGQNGRRLRVRQERTWRVLGLVAGFTVGGVGGRGETREAGGGEGPASG